MRITAIALAAVLLPAWAVGQQGASAQTGARAAELKQCSICHGRHEFKVVEPDGSERPLFIDSSELARSVHAKWQCVDCHAEIDKIPHPAALPPVNCQRCHFPGNPVGAPENIDYEGYVKSVHGRLRASGNMKAPLCQSCHGSHLVLKHDNPDSQVNKLHVPETCGRCHVEEYALYRRSIHGTSLLVKNNLEAPSCTDCHGEHSILPAKDTASGVSISNIPKTCSHCHGQIAFNARFNIPINPVKTFKHSFHGIANELGSKKVANCASCHTSHDVLPPQDPRSSVNPANIPSTCGKIGCHEGANANYARGRFHIDPESRDSGIIFWVALFFKILTISTLAALLVHILMDLIKKLRERHAGGDGSE